jgi:hypothetical protein
VAVFAYTRADGSAIVNPSLPLGTIVYGVWGTIPPKTLYGTGQAISRASYPGYFTAVTRAQSGTLTAGNNTIASVGNTAGLGAGMPLEGTGIQSGTTVSSVTSSTIVMSTTATANGAQTVTAFLTGYGSGGDSTTVGVKDCRGRVLAGRPDMGGTDAGNLTSTYLGANAKALNAAGGEQAHTLTIAELPVVTPTGFTTVGPLLLGINGLNAQRYSIVGGNASDPLIYGQPGAGSGLRADFPQTNFDLHGTPFGSGQSHNNLQPTAIAECVVAVLP